PPDGTHPRSRAFEAKTALLRDCIRKNQGDMDREHEDSRRSNWHSLPAEQVLDKLGTSRTGLSEHEAQERLRQFGANALPQAKAVHPLVRFAAQFNSVLIYFLLAAAAAAAVLGHGVDAAVILAVVLVN